MTPVISCVMLALICVLSFSIRLFPFVVWGSVIHEFDPQFNFRVTKFLAKHGVYELLDWFDDRAWYPLGRTVGTTVYPGLMAGAAGLQWLLTVILRVPISIRDACVFLAPTFAALACVAQFLLTQEVTEDTRTALLSAMLLSVSPAYISRSTAGSFDNEGIAIFLLIFTFYLWVKAVKTGAMIWAASAAISYFTMALSWGGYVFIINIIPIHVLVLLLSGHYSAKLYVAYSTFYPLATLGAMSVPFIGFNTVLKGETAGSHGVFGLLQVYAFMQYLSTQIPKRHFVRLLRTCLSTGVAIAGSGLLFALVAREASMEWAKFDTAGPDIRVQKLDAAFVFMIVYSTLAFYFSGIMVRLLLTLAPAACYLSAVGASGFMQKIMEMTSRDTAEAEGCSAEEGKTNEITSKTVAQDDEKEDSRKSHMGDILLALGAKLRFQPDEKVVGEKPKPPRALQLLPLACGFLLVIHARHSSKIAKKVYSSTSLVFEKMNMTTMKKDLHDDYREAFTWLRLNTPENAKILSWWDYGYQITTLANRTVLVDNNTWNNTHIATVGRVLTSREDDALPILRSLDVDYVFLLFGGKVGMPGDDLDKLPWIVKIAEGVFPDDVVESEFQVNGRYIFHENATLAMTQSVLYKLSYFEFNRAQSLPVKENEDPVFGWDMNRRVRISRHNIDLHNFEHVFTSDTWMVRIYRVKPLR
ncbi:unnamed protein product [Peronospora destructor]|uniref:dolichyl-diphosphooligosaccharide--protein glycotransferase n=1 Tax=Peronospora destructor TaxID=86335 RepID=A0AAV0V765_9STRA|nr:unnamed protein product [Peronospora destructor]